MESDGEHNSKTFGPVDSHKHAQLDQSIRRAAHDRPLLTQTALLGKTVEGRKMGGWFVGGQQVVV